MDRTRDTRDEQFWSARNFGALLVFTALVSVALRTTTGHWPADLGGWAAAAFAGVGLVLIGHSLTHRITAKQSVSQ
ncbi:hypothetical protein ACFQMA_17575 [Halosimplex aquaticum]|uniref:Uncharacterized protein n=1 Tax=Halosimplex aquaticum TaxID=3026162 RepID=A0ABD5Y7D3_9EURY|nr:hypothetical protein [Halosimplex aquaticum]